MSQPERVRALIAVGMGQRPHGLVLATDSAWLASDIEHLNDFTDDLGLDIRGLTAGLHLWGGTVERGCNQSKGYEPESEYTRTDCCCVLDSELPALLLMVPEESENT